MAFAGVMVVFGSGFEATEITATGVVLLVFFDVLIGQSTSGECCEDASSESWVWFGCGGWVAPGFVVAVVTRWRRDSAW